MRWTAVVGVGLLLVVAGCVVVAPGAVSSFGWKHFVGPVYADAMNQPSATWQGVEAFRGYNYVNELTYAFLVVLACIAVFRWVDRSDVTVDDRFVMSFVPFIVFGGLLRVVEDAAVLPFGLRVLIVSPIGYFLVLGLAVAVFALALRYEDELGWGWRGVVWYVGVIGAVFCFLVLLLTQSLSVDASVLLVGGSLVALAVSYGLVVVGRSLVPENRFVWQRSGMAAVMGHTLDGAVTSLSIAFLGYGEKHPLSQAVMDLAGSPFGFLVVKMAAIVAIVSMIRHDEDVAFVRLMMLAIVAVGLGPAVRSGTRALFGV